ncbi:MAG: DUF2141 domain-containing protein [Mesoflavibacter sp.]|nr:DUF2141 domain-containing protein [Mesoflavibacter sp.]
MHSTGIAKVAIVNSKKNFSEDQPFKGFDFNIANKEVMQTIQLPTGIYAIKAYHDENSNGQLDKRAMGMPKERYGFSNNARGFLGLPGYEETTFELQSSGKKLSIILK